MSIRSHDKFAPEPQGEWIYADSAAQPEAVGGGSEAFGPARFGNGSIKRKPVPDVPQKPAGLAATASARRSGDLI